MVVGIGASAGGLAALKEFFASVPPDSDLIFVVVVHLSPNHESHLAEILQPHVRIPVEQVRETLHMEPNRVYLIPPNANLDAVDTHLRLTELEASRRHRAPVDHFFRTLAETHDGASVGVVLTGNGCDGALGVKAIKEKGGLIVVQTPSEAEFDAMPQSAIATGAADLVLPLAQIPGAIIRFARTQPRLGSGRDLAQQANAPIQKLFALIRGRTGRDFSRYKRSTLIRRIERRMQLHHVDGFGAYLDLLRREPDEVRTLSDDFLITVTSFFRDPHLFKRLEREVLPKIFTRKERDDTDAAANSIRIWSVGCATGEEAYSLAIACLEEAGHHKSAPRIQVFATDLHEPSLERARGGFYPGDIETDVSTERLRRFFVKEDGGYRVQKAVREMVVFAPHNVLSDPPFSRLDLISCRNLLIYLDRNAQREIDQIFHYALRPGGFLIVGGSEVVVRAELYAPEAGKPGIYVRRDVPTPEARLPSFPPRMPESYINHDFTAGRGRRSSYGELHQRIVERYAPPSILVGPDDRIVHVSEQAGRYLVHPGGELTASVFKVVREDLRLDLRAAITEARKNGVTAHSKPVNVRFNGTTRPVVLRVHASADPKDEGFILVMFDEPAIGEAGESHTVTPPQQGVREIELDAELELTRQRQQAIVEEYETSQEEMRAANEELQSANEELRSTMEELETSKEELQSLNEELQTVNQENRHKVEELSQLTGDLQNLLSATDIATIFLDREMRIMRFTPKVGELFNVRFTDRGRPLADLTHRLGYEELDRDARTVLKDLIPIEREVRDDSGHWYLARVLPYRSSSDRIEGIVITLVDVTETKRAEEAMRESEERASRELAAMTRLHELISRLLVSPDLPSALAEVLEAVISMSGADRGNVQLKQDGGVLRIAAQRGFDEPFLARFDTVTTVDRTPCAVALATGKRVVATDLQTDNDWKECWNDAKAGGYRGVQSTPLISHSGQVLGVLSTHYTGPCHFSDRDLRILDLYARPAADFIERVQTAVAMDDKSRRLEEEDERKGFFLATLGHELRNPLGALDNALRLLTEGGDVGELLPMMSAQVQQLTDLVNDLLEIARITRGTVSLRKTSVDLARIVRSAAQTVGDAVSAKEQDLSLPALGSLPIEGDPTRLEQVVVNLLSNATKYTPRGGRIEITLERQGNEAVLAVRDEGRGLAPEDFARIFEPFVQMDPGAGGLGIGLPLVKRLVELHGGSIRVESEGRGRGCTFTLRLPIGDAGEPAAEMQRAQRARTLPPGTDILIIDDLVDNAQSLAILLELRGAHSSYALTGNEGLERALNERPEVLLIDLGMPDISGYEVAKRIRAQSWDVRPLLVAVTGFGDPEAERQALEAGFDARLVKPVDHERLFALITAHVAAARSRRETSATEEHG